MRKTITDSISSSSAGSITKTSQLPVDDRILTLKSYGQEYISERKYKKASLYYSAILQLLEGIAGKEPDELRMKCSSILAFCNLKDGQYYDAIARCTEVIEQSLLSYPPKVHEIKSLSSSQQHLLGITYYRRGLSFNNLGLPNLAVIDWKIAHLLIPNNPKVLSRMQFSKGIDSDMDTDGKTQIDSTVTINRNLTESDEASLESVGEVILETSATESEEDLANILDYSLQISEPKHFSKLEIERLLRSSTTSGSTSLFNQFSNGLNGREDNMASSLGSLGGLGGGLGALGGMGGLGGLFGAGLGKGGLRSQLSMLAPLAQQFLGVDRATIDQVLDIGDALFDTFKLFTRILSLLAEYSGAIMAVIWITASLLLK